jgi:hypothetical protein
MQSADSFISDITLQAFEKLLLILTVLQLCQSGAGSLKLAVEAQQIYQTNVQIYLIACFQVLKTRCTAA